MARKCRWKDGCITNLAQYNKGDLCSVHQSMSPQITHGTRRTPVSAATAERLERPRRKSSSAAKPVVISEQLRLRADKVAEAVCLEFGVPREDMTWEHENPAMNLAKNVIAYILKKDCDMTLKEIRDYLQRSGTISMVHYYLTKITATIFKDPGLAERVDKIRLSIARAPQESATLP